MQSAASDTLRELPVRNVTYYKRHRMELDLRCPRPEAILPVGFSWVPWSFHLLDTHASVKHQCFAGELDSAVFPALATLTGSRELMATITSQWGFCPEATWLVANAQGAIGTVQGLRDAQGAGGIQNLGVVAGFRGLGLGRALLLKGLAGFAAVGVQRAFLEVTALNTTALRMYRELGFRSHKTIYRPVEKVPTSEAAPVGLGT